MGVSNPEQATPTERLDRVKPAESGSVATPTEEIKETDINIIAANAILEGKINVIFNNLKKC